VINPTNAVRVAQHHAMAGSLHPRAERSSPQSQEKREWSQRQRRRRGLKELYGAGDRPESEIERELEQRLRREAYLGRVGILDLLLHWPPRLGAKLIRSGLDAQYDYYTEPASRRRVPPDFSDD